MSAKALAPSAAARASRDVSLRCIVWLCTEGAADVAGLTSNAAEWDASKEVHLSRQEIAEMLGVYRETVTNALDRLKGLGAVEISRRRILLRDPDLLRQVSDE